MNAQQLRTLRDGLQMISQLAYDIGDWDAYEKYTDEYILLEDANCTCPVRLNVKVESCPFHGDLVDTGPQAHSAHGGRRKTVSTDWGYMYYVRGDDGLWTLSSYLVIEDKLGVNVKHYMDGRPDEVERYEPA